MEFKFDANQDFQIQAIESVTDLFTGQPRTEVDLKFLFGQSAAAAIPNRLDISESDILSNLHEVQGKNKIRLDSQLIPIKEQIENDNGLQDVRFYNFSVEMETGTGKTYVYIRTALELFKRYGFRKYIVVVPSVAIREGVYKTLQVTEKHLLELYDNTPYRYYIYNSANLSQVRQFALSSGVEIMIMTIQAFNKASAVIRQTTDRLQGDTPVHLVQGTNPVLILDEPQNMESEKSIAALAILNPLLALRYSATHRNPYNVVNRLSPFEAYRQGLVKRIEVASVVQEDDTILPYLKLEGITTNKKTIKAKIRVHKLMKAGNIKETVLTVGPGDSLQVKTGRTEYAEFDIDEINPGGQFVRFANNMEIKVEQEFGADKESIFEAQIRYTIEEHFRKQALLKPANIKVLTLFFIDRVDNYAPADGIIRVLFNGIFNELKEKYPDWKNKEPEDVQAAYFAQRRDKSGNVILEDSKTGEAQKDEQAYNLIMKDKERLLSFEEPVSFIFSHSALREGWDNPNVFQICTMNQTASEIKKRQEVGRGVRLSLDQTGERIKDERINVLTVVANESYEKYVSQLQSEIALEYQQEIEERYGKSIADLTDEERIQIAEEYGEGILPPKPKNARKRSVAKLRKKYTLKPEFKDLWEKIKHKTKYQIKIDTDKLIKEVVEELNKAKIRVPRVAITKARVDVSTENAFEALQMSAAKTVIDLAGRYPLPNLVDVMGNLMEHTTPPVYLTRETLLEIIKKVSADCKKGAMDNPNEFATQAVSIIKEKLADQLVEGIQYEKINKWYEMTQLELDIPGWEDYFVPAKKSVYDQVICDSTIEREFVEGLERRDDVKMYIKLPSWFVVQTPIGTYNPDWAIVMEERDEHGQATGRPLLYLVRETKSTTDFDKLRPDEQRKIKCGERHFKDALEISYRVVTSAKDLP